jgi:hypothetical protein
MITDFIPFLLKLQAQNEKAQLNLGLNYGMIFELKYVLKPGGERYVSEKTENI